MCISKVKAVSDSMIRLWIGFGRHVNRSGVACDIFLGLFSVLIFEEQIMVNMNSHK